MPLSLTQERQRASQTNASGTTISLIGQNSGDGASETQQQTVVDVDTEEEELRLLEEEESPHRHPPQDAAGLRSSSSRDEFFVTDSGTEFKVEDVVEVEDVEKHESSRRSGVDSPSVNSTQPPGDGCACVVPLLSRKSQSSFFRASERFEVQSPDVAISESTSRPAADKASKKVVFESVESLSPRAPLLIMRSLSNTSTEESPKARDEVIEEEGTLESGEVKAISKQQHPLSVAIPPVVKVSAVYHQDMPWLAEPKFSSSSSSDHGGSRSKSRVVEELRKALEQAIREEKNVQEKEPVPHRDAAPSRNTEQFWPAREDWHHKG